GAKMDGGRNEGIERNVTSTGIAAGDSMSGVTASAVTNGGSKIGGPAEPLDEHTKVRDRISRNASVPGFTTSWYAATLSR
ncbi:MAG: hypothetical protein ACJ8EK_06545, partial [Bradyrhizobium sp.]